MNIDFYLDIDTVIHRFDGRTKIILFLGIFLVLWIVWTVYMLHKHRVDKKGMWKMEYPLVPVIAFAFYVWVVTSYLIL